MDLKACLGIVLPFQDLSLDGKLGAGGSSPSRFLQQGWRHTFLKQSPARKTNANSMSVRARIKWGVDRRLDVVVDRSKPVKMALRIRTLIARQPNRVMSLKELALHRKYLGIVGKKRCIDLLKKFPGVFEVVQTGGSHDVRLTQEAEEHLRLETRTREQCEATLVERLRRLLMMSCDRRIPVFKLTHLKTDLGLPDSFQHTLLPKYPEFFRCVNTEEGMTLELVRWDSDLAVSALERNKMQENGRGGNNEADSNSGIGGKSGGKRGRPQLNLPSGYEMNSNDKSKLAKFLQMPYISPYSDAKDLDPSSMEAEKRAVGVVHEFLSLTLEKRTRIDFLTHFRHEYKFSQRLYHMLVRHPEMFYVCKKGYRDSVFLTEAYKGSDVIEKDPLLVAQEFLSDLAISKRVFQVVDETPSLEFSDSDDGEWSDDADEDEGPTEQSSIVVETLKPGMHLVGGRMRDVW